jgi:hypothetical protein
LQAGVTLGTNDPEVAGWLASAREILLGLRALSLVAQADRIASGDVEIAPRLATSEEVAPSA